MKKILFIGLLIFSILAGCQSPPEPATPTATKTMPTLVVNTPTIAHTKTPTTTYIPMTPTPLVISTLSPTEWASIIDISNNQHPECELPCWLSLIPGETTEEDAIIILQENQLSINDKYVRNATVSYRIENEFGIIGMVSERGVLDFMFFDYILIHPDFLKNGDLLEQLGIPDKLLFNYSETEGLPLFDILMIYEELKTSIMYSGRTEGKNTGLSICDRNISSITVWLTARDAVNPTPYFREGDPPIPEPEFYNIDSNELLKFLGSEMDCIAFDAYP